MKCSVPTNSAGLVSILCLRVWDNSEYDCANAPEMKEDRKVMVRCRLKRRAATNMPILSLISVKISRPDLVDDRVDVDFQSPF